MPKRKGLTDKQIAQLARKPKRYIIPDPELRGHYLRVPPAGPIVFTAVARGPGGRQTWATVGTDAELKVDPARSKAREILSRIKAGLAPIEAPKPQPDSVAVVAENWLRRVVDREKHRTAGETRRIIGKYVVPHIGARAFADLRRSEIAKLLDLIQDQHGARMADRTLAVLKSIANWMQSRDDDYISPFVRGMRRDTNTPRERTLTDDEIRRIWQLTEGTATGACLRLLLLTGQRRTKVIKMCWPDIGTDGTWTIPTEAREKGNAGALKLPKVALDLIRKQPRMSGQDRVFGFGEDTLDRAKAAIGGDWRLHDLRRTARSLMSRAGVLSEHAERVLGHAIGGVEGIYDRHAYENQKADALRKLAALIERIINPPAKNVVALQK
jgi:integrase